MVIALLTDLHANLPAVEACLTHAKNQGALRYVLLGDYVGYGADPGAVVDRVAEMVSAGAQAVRGNHDAVLVEADLNPDAATSARWTAAQLRPDQRAFLNGLPLTIRDGDRLYAHADASAPAKWRYVRDAETAARSLNGCDARLVFCGHAHAPALYASEVGGKAIAFRPIAGVKIPLLRQRRWQIVLGSVGQPRNGDPAASYALFDDRTQEIAFQRVGYDIAAAADAIRKAGLPYGLAERLYVGR
jgi:diadenosine tetraphosphatase ApaH/serine/threonine PP2A family protein phosphatase